MTLNMLLLEVIYHPLAVHAMLNLYTNSGMLTFTHSKHKVGYSKNYMTFRNKLTF